MHVCTHVIDGVCVLQWDPEPIEEGVDLLEIGQDALVNQIQKVGRWNVGSSKARVVLVECWISKSLVHQLCLDSILP